MRSRLLIVGAGLLVLALVVAGLLWWRSAQLTDLQRAVDYAPPDAQRLSWTDWASVREELGSDVTGESGASELENFLDTKEGAVLCTHRPVLPSVFDALGVDRLRLAPAGLLVVHHRKGKVVATEPQDA